MHRSTTDTHPAPPQTLDVDGADARLRVYDYGSPRGASAPIVLLHGIQDQALSLDPVARAFRSRHRVVSFDLRGHGDSSKPSAYTFSHYLGDLHGIITELQLERPILIGHSLGGQIVKHYAGVFSEVPSKVVSIEGLGPPFRPDAVPANRLKARSRSSVLNLLQPVDRGRPFGIDEAVELFQRFHPRLDPQRAKELVEIGVEPHGDGWRWKWDPRVLTTWASTSTEISEQRWSWIECPVLLVTAELSAEFWSRRRGIRPEDAEIDPPELARRLALFRDVRQVEVKGAGHMVHYDQPDALNAAILDFVESP